VLFDFGSVFSTRRTRTRAPPSTITSTNKPASVRACVVLRAQLLNLSPTIERLLKKLPGTHAVDTVSRRRTVKLQRRLVEVQVLELVASYEDGASVPELVENFGIHRTTVMAHLQRRGVPRRPNVRKLSDKHVAQAARLYASGLSTVKIGEQFDVDAETVRKALIREGVRLRPRRGCT
jgi:hypothetical protein